MRPCPFTRRISTATGISMSCQHLMPTTRSPGTKMTGADLLPPTRSRPPPTTPGQFTPTTSTETATWTSCLRQVAMTALRGMKMTETKASPTIQLHTYMAPGQCTRPTSTATATWISCRYRIITTMMSGGIKTTATAHLRPIAFGDRLIIQSPSTRPISTAMVTWMFLRHAFGVTSNGTKPTIRPTPFKMR